MTVIERLILNQREHIIHRAFRDTENARHDALWTCESCNLDAITDRHEFADDGLQVLMASGDVQCVRCFGYPGEMSAAEAREAAGT